jgi:hypothetical protein
MNYFAHALPFLDEPYFVAGTGVPDWLTVVDRPVRVRMKRVEPLLRDPEATTAAVAGGVRQHLLDDARFHKTRAFVETSLELSCRARDVLRAETGFRPAFLGHLLVEVLLDAALAAEQPARLEAYYRALAAVDPDLVQQAVNRMASQPTERLAVMISQFCRHRILWDYLEDGKLMARLNQVMRRVGLEPLPDDFNGILSGARRLVTGRVGELLAGIPVERSASGESMTKCE